MWTYITGWRVARAKEELPRVSRVHRVQGGVLLLVYLAVAALVLFGGEPMSFSAAAVAALFLYAGKVLSVRTGRSKTVGATLFFTWIALFLVYTVQV